MGDPISAAGTAVGVLSLGIQVCSGIFKYYEAWRDYDNDIHFIRAGVEQLSHGFTLVRDTMSSENIKHQPGAQQIEATVLKCEDGIRALSRRLDKAAATKPMRALPAPGSGDGAAVVWLEDARRHLLYPFRRGTILKLRDEISRLRETLEPALTLINIAIAGDTVGELSAFRIEQNKWRQEEENRRILDWLSPLDFQARQKSLVSKVQPGSIKDIFAMPDFVNWIQAATDVPPGLWCHGDMGSGKSVTCAAVAEHLSNSVGHDRSVSVLAIYCDWQDTQVQTVDALIGSLVKQCVEALADIPHHIKSLYAEHRFGKLPLKAPLSLKALLELAASLRQIYIVVDGIDELAYEHTNSEPVHSRMASIEGALDSLLSNPAPASANIRIFSTSRFLPQNVSLSLWTMIRFSVPELHLRAYITRALEENDWASPWESQSLAVHVRQDTQLMREIADCCVKRADGLYLLLKLTVTHLKRQLNMRQLRRALANLPHTFDEVMKTCVHRVLNQSPARRNLAARTILWISHAYRPMTIQEIQEALSIEIGDDETSPEGWYDIQVIVSSCGGLVTIDEATQTLRFVSFGVQQHLKSNDSVFPEDPHWVILETCFSFFQFREFAECSNDAWAQYRDVNDSTLETWRETKTQALLVEHPFLAYAARHWHLHQHTAMHPDKAQITAKLLSDYDKAGFLYMMYYTTQFQSPGAMTTRITGLHLSCLLGLSSATELLMSPVEEQRDKRSNEPTDSFGRTPLWLAAACGHLDTVTLLLENGHDPSGRGSGPAYGYSCFRWWHPAWARDEYYSQAVEVAAEGGFTDIVHKLITGGAKLDYYKSTFYYEKVTGIYGGALEAAVFNNHEETVDVILASNQEVRSSTIHAAVYGGNVSIMTKLLDVQLNKSGWGRYDPLSFQRTLPLQELLSYALYAAALAGRLNIAQVLLSRGADVNARTFGFHCTALAAASAYSSYATSYIMPSHRASQNRSAEELATWLQKLAGVGLHYHDEPDPEACIICTKCGYAIKADGDRVTRHLHDKHNVLLDDRKGLANFIRSLRLPDPKDLPSRPDGSAPHPHLSLQTVFDCRHCEMRSASMELLGRHVRQNHRQRRGIAKQDWVRDHIQNNVIVQSWTANGIHDSWIVKPLQGSTIPILQAGFPLDVAGADARLQAHAEQMMSEERRRLQAEYGRSSPSRQDAVSTITSAASGALMTNWLRRTGWSVLLEGVHKRMALTLCKLPSRACQPLRIIDSTGMVVCESSMADERKLVRILLAADWLLDRCYDTVRHTDVAIRRWLRSKFPHQPYKAPFELVSSARSDKLYRSELKQYLCFYLRLSRLSSATTRAIFGSRTLADTQLESLQALWHDRVWEQLDSVLPEAEYGSMGQHAEEEEDEDDNEEEDDEVEEDEENDDEDEEEGGESDEGGGLSYANDGEVGPAHLNADISAKDVELGRQRCPRDHAIGILLRHVYSAATEEFMDGTAGSTLLVYFSAIRGISTTGKQFLDPSHFTPILARLIYIIRLACLEALLPRSAHESIGIPARPRLGQLKHLNKIRVEKLCDGVLSPLGEFLSLLAYGSSLRRAALPSFCFEWSDDSEEISWDGEYCLKMGDFRNLIHGVLEAASQCCQRLMFEWEPECRNMRALRDRLSDTSIGYSFVSDPANNLREEYLLLMERACLSSVDGLLTVDRSTASSSWDIRSVRAYLSRHDDFLRVLMILLHLTGGKGGRISELLSLEIHNTAFQPRGLSLYRGGVMSITRHHKARVWTNNEFQVARFYPQAVSMLIYQYLVYIRPLTNMLLRKCLHRPPLGSLLFDPATSSTAWTTAVFTREFRRLASMTPGIPPVLGAQLYRQLCTAIATRHVRAVVDHFNQHDDVTTRAQDDVVMAWQSGHRPL